MNLADIGKVLIVDDLYPTIEEVTKSFLEKGIQVQYWKGSGNLPESIFNARIVVIDLDLTDLKMRIPGEIFFFPVIDALEKIPGPSMVVLVGREFEKEDPGKLKKIYKKRTGRSLCGFIAKKGLTKAELADPTSLEKLILEVLEKNEILKLILTWEAILDRAKDVALSEIIIDNVERSIRTLVKIICMNLGENKAAASTLINEMLRLVSRRTSGIKNFDYLVELIGKVSKTKIKITKAFASAAGSPLFSNLIFYSPSKEEDPMTGDILETSNELQYAVVFSPKCDLAQNKTKKVLVCYGFPLKKSYFRRKDYPPIECDPEIAKLRNKGLKMLEIAPKIEKRYLKGTLPKSFHIIWNFQPKENVFGICLNFSNVKSIDRNEIKKWKRIARIDSPYIDELIQKYGNLITRVGTLEINQSPRQLGKTIKKLDKS